MSDPAQVALLDEYLGTALSASNDLVATLCGQMDDVSLSADERRVLLMLWASDGVSEPGIAERLHTDHIEDALEALEQKDLVTRVASKEGRSVWLTGKGRAMWKVCGTEEMSRRVDRLKSEIVSLRDVLQRTVGLLADGNASLGTFQATA
jgi:DNA-binding MarR family transcriptional regulator